MSNFIKIAFGVALGLLLFVIALVLLTRPSSGWSHSIISDPMTDGITANATVLATDGRGALELSCKNGGALALVFQTPTRMGGYVDDENYVDRILQYRFDNRAIADTVAVFGDNFIGFREEENWEKPIIEGLRSAEKLAIGANSVRGEHVQLVFDVADAEEAMKHLRKACQKK